MLTKVSGDLIGQNTVTNQNIAASVQDAYGWRNRIINGDMRIDQRNAGASITPTNGQYGCDRWRNGLSVGSKFSVQQDSSAPSGFTNSTKATSLSAYSVGAAETYQIQQYVEGYNTADFAWGTASASTVTLSFSVRSSLTGTFGGSLQNSDRSRCFPFSYTITAADTWEQKTVTIPGDTTGTWLTTNGIGIQVNFSIGSGTSVSGTAGEWSGSTLFSATGAVSVVGTSGATFYITGVQLEAGSVATAFERRDYGRELAMCQRYFRRISSGNASSGGIIGMGAQTSTTGGYAYVSVSPPMRATPTIAINQLIVSDSVTFDTAASLGNITGTQDSVFLDLSYAASGAQFRPISLRAVFTNTAGRLDMSSEL